LHVVALAVDLGAGDEQRGEVLTGAGAGAGAGAQVGVG